MEITFIRAEEIARETDTQFQALLKDALESLTEAIPLSARAQYVKNVDFWARTAYTNPKVIPGIGKTEAAFEEGMTTAIQNGTEGAWIEGAAAVGLGTEDIEDDEWQALGEIQTEQIGFLADYFTWLSTAKEVGLTLDQAMQRAMLWYNVYDATLTKAKVIMGSNEKLEWVLGPTEKHCTDCAKLSGRVYRAKTWLRYDVMPQSHRLDCHGFNCACELLPTDKRVTPGKPPRLTGGMGETAFTEIGTASSGNWGHAGVPGQQGGSAPGVAVDRFIDDKLVGIGGPVTEKQIEVIRNVLEQTPVAILNVISGIDVCVTPRGAGKVWREDGDTIEGVEVGRASRCLAWYSKKRGVVVLNDNTGGVSKGTLNHEIGHAVLCKSNKGKVWEDRYEKDKKFDRTSVYAKKNVEEGFAETYQSYAAMRQGGYKRPTAGPFVESYKVLEEVIDGLS